MTEAVFGLLGVLLGAIVSGLVMWTVARRDRLHSEDVARADRGQRHVAARKDQWWSRARWALDLLLHESGAVRLLGLRILDVLASDEWADTRELDIIEVAIRSRVVVDLADDPGDTESAGGGT